MIALVKENKHLWHNSVEGFTGKVSKRVKLFIEIAEEIGTTAYEANRRFTSLRERYGKESKKHELGAQDCITWPYYEDLNFLSDVIRRRDKRKSVKIETFKEEMETESIVETPEDFVEPSYEETQPEISRQEDDEKPEIQYVTHTIRSDSKPGNGKRKLEPMDRSIYVIEQEESEKDSEDETIEAAFKYFKVELRKMEQKKREYILDKMMMAFLNAKLSYPK